MLAVLRVHFGGCPDIGALREGRSAAGGGEQASRISRVNGVAALELDRLVAEIGEQSLAQQHQRDVRSKLVHLGRRPGTAWITLAPLPMAHTRATAP
jgi:hypothetical protein